MFGFFHCTKRLAMGGDTRILIEDATLAFGPRERVVVLGPPGCGKTVLQRMLAGREKPSSGTVKTPRGLSWPIGFAGMLHPVLTGEQNIRTLAAMLGAEPDRTSGFVSLFSELGDHYHRPLQEYSGGMRARLAFSFSMAVPFAFYVADDIIGTGDPSFRDKCDRMMFRRLEDAGLFLTTSSPRIAERFGERFAVVHERRIVECGSISEAKTLLEKARDMQDEFETVLAGLNMA